MANKPNLIKTGAEIAFETTLDTTIDSDDTSLILTSADGLPSSNFCLILDYDVPTKREAVAIESRTGTTCTVYADGRGHDSTSATSHTGGVCKVRATILPSMVDEIIDAFDAEHDDDGKHTVDTIAEKTSGSGVTVDGLLIKDGGIMGWDGWQTYNGTFTRTGNHTFTVTGDQTAIFTKGTKVSYNDGSVDYGVVASSAEADDVTTVTLITNTSYVMADTTITAPRYSYARNPQGFPNFFNFSLVVKGDSNPALGDATVTNFFSSDGTTITVYVRIVFGSSSSYGGNRWYFEAPVECDNTLVATNPMVGQAVAYDTSATAHNTGFTAILAGTPNRLEMLRAGENLGGTTAAKWGVTVPFTWASGDILGATWTYQI